MVSKGEHFLVLGGEKGVDDWKGQFAFFYIVARWFANGDEVAVVEDVVVNLEADTMYSPTVLGFQGLFYPTTEETRAITAAKPTRNKYVETARKLKGSIVIYDPAFML